MSGAGPGGPGDGTRRDRLIDDLAKLGLAEVAELAPAGLARPGAGPPRGGAVLVHSSMRRLGVASPAAMVAALRAVAGPQVTIVVPAQTTLNSTTGLTFRRATAGLTQAEVVAFENRLAPFDKDTTPSQGMGALAEYVRRQPGAVRSAHPQASFAALGPRAHDLMAVHDLDCHLGERSPLGALYAAGAAVLLLGVGYEACTALHLAEYRLPWPPPTRRYRCYTLDQGQRVRHEFLAADLDEHDFGQLGRALDGEPFVRSGPVGASTAHLMPVRAAVDFAVHWLTRHRKT